MSMMPIRIIFGKEIIRLAEEYDYIAVCADTKCTSFEDFGKIFPERQVSIGIAEQNLLGVASGLASEGHKVVLSTYSTFATMRACEQLRTYICNPKMDVMIMGTHAGLQTGSEGVSHTAIEDMAILRAIPNMTIVQPSDGISARALARAALNFRGPLYVRLPFDAVEEFNSEEYTAKIGKANWIKRSGKDATLIATGIMLKRTIEAAEILKKEGIDVKVMEIHTIKPIDREAIIQAAKETNAIVTIEDHTIFGGLGGAVAEILCEEYPVRMKRIGIQDCFAKSGDAEILYKKNKMALDDIVNEVRKLVKIKNE